MLQQPQADRPRLPQLRERQRHPPAGVDARHFPWPNRQSDSVWYHLLPYIEQHPLFNQGTKANPVIAANGYIHQMWVNELAPVSVKTFLCPSDGTNPDHLTDTRPPVKRRRCEYATGSYIGNVMVLDPSVPRTIVAGMLDGTSNTTMIGHRLENCDPSVVWGTPTNFFVFNLPWGEPRQIHYRQLPMIGMPTYHATDNAGTVAASKGAKEDQAQRQRRSEPEPGLHSRRAAVPDQAAAGLLPAVRDGHHP